MVTMEKVPVSKPVVLTLLSLLLTLSVSEQVNFSAECINSTEIIGNSSIIFPSCQRYLLKSTLFVYMPSYQLVVNNLGLLEVALHSAEYCSKIIVSYVCNYVYPSCGEIDDNPVGICPDECKRLVLEANPCTPEFQYLFSVSGLNGFVFKPQCNNTLLFVQQFGPWRESQSDECINVTDGISATTSHSLVKPSDASSPGLLANNATSNISVVSVSVSITFVVIMTAIICISAILIMYKYKCRKIQKFKMEPHPNLELSIYQPSNAICSSNKADLFQLVAEDILENPTLTEALVPFQSMALTEEIGHGAFGIVFKGTLLYNPHENNKAEIEVADKTIKNSSASYSELKGFLEESVIMCGFDHPHVLGLIGICLDPSNSPHLLLPFMENGDLRTYLKNKREDCSFKNNKYIEGLELDTLVRLCSEVAEGMEYLTAKKLVHRDLAARNCMVDGSVSVRVADFGLTRDIYETDYYRQSQQGRVPVKWMAPESLHDRISNEKTDVWSYGVTCWEIFSLGRTPYPTVPNPDMMEYLEKGNRLKKPSLCPNAIYAVMSTCWRDVPSERPDFSELLQTLETCRSETQPNTSEYMTVIVEEDHEYLDIL